MASLTAAIMTGFGTLGNMVRQSHDLPVPTCLARMGGHMVGGRVFCADSVVLVLENLHH